MKILYLLDSLDRSGTETLVLDICRNAENHRSDLTFAATGGDSLKENFVKMAPRIICLTRCLPLVIWSLCRAIKTLGIV